MKKNSQYILTLEPLTLARIGKIISNNENIVLGQDCINRVKVNREYLEAKISQDNKTIYGINTGFGSLC
ncbi:MAG: aromatic amino acid lyase, partial [Saprospiraceae bacterium]